MTILLLQSDAGRATGGIILIICGLVIYFIPSMMAFLRGHHNKLAITALNFFLGWTFIGWVVSLVWALTKPSGK